MFVGALILRPRGVFTRWDVWYAFRCFLAASIMVPAIWGLSTRAGVGILPAVCYGVVIYALAAYALQVVRNDDFKQLVAAIGARIGMGDAAQLDWATLRAYLGIGGRVVGTRLGIARLRGAISRPLGAVSRPVARAGRVVSQPLAQVRVGVTSVIREQYYASPVSQYVRKAGELFSQEEIPEATSDATLEAVMLGSLETQIAEWPNEPTAGQFSEQAANAQAFPGALPPGIADEWEPEGERVMTDQRRVQLRPGERKDPKTMQRGETEPLPPLEQARSRGIFLAPDLPS